MKDRRQIRFGIWLSFHDDGMVSYSVEYDLPKSWACKKRSCQILTNIRHAKKRTGQVDWGQVRMVVSFPTPHSQNEKFFETVCRLVNLRVLRKYNQEVFLGNGLAVFRHRSMSATRQASRLLRKKSA